MTEASHLSMSKRDADNARVAAAMRRRQCQFEVAAEKSRSRWASKKEIVRRYQRKQVATSSLFGPVVWFAQPGIGCSAVA